MQKRNKQGKKKAASRAPKTANPKIARSIEVRLHQAKFQREITRSEEKLTVKPKLCATQLAQEIEIQDQKVK